MSKRDAALLIFGAVLIAVGVFMFSIPAGLIVTGSLLAALVLIP